MLIRYFLCKLWSKYITDQFIILRLKDYRIIIWFAWRILKTKFLLAYRNTHFIVHRVEFSLQEHSFHSTQGRFLAYRNTHFIVHRVDFQLIGTLISEYIGQIFSLQEHSFYSTQGRFLAYRNTPFRVHRVDFQQ